MKTVRGMGRITFGDAMGEIRGMDPEEGGGQIGSGINYLSVVKMTHDEKVVMYRKLKKDDLISMLIESNRIIEMRPLTVTLNGKDLADAVSTTWMDDN